MIKKITKFTLELLLDWEIWGTVSVEQWLDSKVTSTTRLVDVETSNETVQEEVSADAGRSNNGFAIFAGREVGSQDAS